MEEKVYKFSEILGQNRAVNLLKSAITKNRIAHSYIFTGPEGVGKKTTAQAFCFHLFCEVDQTNPCGNCINCKKLGKKLHPDVKYIYPEKRDIKINTIRLVEIFLRTRPLSAPYKIIIIESAEKMNLEAANALLKSLEEPPSYGIFILITDNLTNLLPTIISRSQIVRFLPLSEKIIKTYLSEKKNFEESLAETLAELSLGSLGKALEIAEKGLLEDLNAFVKAGKVGKGEQQFQVIEKLAKLDRESLDLFLLLLSLWVWKSYLARKIEIPFPSSLPSELFEEEVERAFLAISQAKRALQYFISPELTLLTLMIKLFSLKEE